MYDEIFIIFLLICFIQLALWVGIYGRILFYTPKPTNGHKHSAISVILAARNESSTLKSNLSTILGQLKPDAELIIVENHSTDDTVAFLKSFEKQFNPGNENLPDLRVIYRSGNDQTGKKSALMAGIEAASNQVLLFVDADCQINQKWSEKMSAALNDSDICLGYGGYISTKGWLNALIRFETVLTAAQYMGMALIRKPYMGVGRNLSYKKEVFDEVNGYESHLDVLSGDDDLFIQEAAKNHSIGIQLDPDAFTFSPAPPDVRSFFLQKRRHLSTSSKYLFGHQIWLTVVGIAQMLFYPLAIFLLICQPSHIAVVIVFLMITIKWIIFARISTIYKEGTLMARFVVLDLLYCIYLWAITPVLFMNGPKKWS